ncbi:TetR family transcriptional regulator [Frondihabitans sp. PAMC 28766]|uniref:TetR/AcrR family transcriptional regulator n=1 Tax=Frondihabitans sp. PAMC 28766 TaxID=1795630 RepID=UPI00078E3AB3|nr:TetR/AcrR family transcriptional regulator [Frondihabitans sp. PAMC 28766]AMM18930.1 TetR family transcriptional regulator [Frondihabitans sp. PAMC 28766]
MRSTPLRKDAARNRALLLDAARAVFAERGLEASLDDVARRAGVGVGTAYRHFANKQDLAAALFADSIDGVIAEAEAALAIDDPWEALVFFFETSAERQARDRGLHEVLMGYEITPDKQNILDRLAPTVTALFDRARAAGILRPDVEPTDSAAVFSMLGMAFEMCSPAHPDLWRRYLTIMLDGLRATDRGALPTRAMTFDEVETGMAAAKH